ncbi:hypothetical protein [Allorhodopirellula heiligendammensis]|uniref:Uncharacterized protein n=1 Tax=Allorhodopirellula heiligendammensis TaxID=2714739 RepID=A0A5C6BWF1_9BACT|nr:hypothetical protein [Allorhodopirellula heiligendammensis]TWU16590.1 hypothetical protein Poly21_37950 [Allorhodopirellula heiligendammensis]
MKSVFCIAAAAVLITLGNTDSIRAAEPGWSPVVVARGEYRDQIKSLPMEQRPYRPLHFYGNTVRRMHYHGTPAPTLRDIVAPVFIQQSRFGGR